MKKLLQPWFALFLLLSLTISSAPANSEDLTNEKRDMEWVGFKQFQEVSRVFVRTTDPVKYRIDTSRPLTVVPILENTAIPIKNNQRALPVKNFDSPVYKIIPKVIEGPSPSTHIEIQLRRAAKFTQVQKDNMLALDFAR